MNPCPPCPVCAGTNAKRTPHPVGFLFECARCGLFGLTEECHHDLVGELSQVPNGKAILSHALRRMSNRDPGLMITTQRLSDILMNTKLPKPREQIENLILTLGRQQAGPGWNVKPDEGWIAEIGALDYIGLLWVMNAAISSGLIMTGGSGTAVYDPNGDMHYNNLEMTAKGWDLYEELLRAHSESRIAFLAMKFGDEQLNRVIHDHVYPAVAATGFKLLNLQDSLKAGLIDDRMRVEIRRARFLLADLTHHSNGAYWEAGFGEGLGKPVIYLCRRDVFKDKDKPTHFDTNHHLTIDWDVGTIHVDMERLKNTIRATLPSEAKLEN